MLNFSPVKATDTVLSYHMHPNKNNDETQTRRQIPVPASCVCTTRAGRPPGGGPAGVHGRDHPPCPRGLKTRSTNVRSRTGFSEVGRPPGGGPVTCRLQNV